jgi:hypothetical protein
MNFVNIIDNVSDLELTPGTCSADTREPRALTADEMRNNRLGKFCSEVYDEEHPGCMRGISEMADLRSMIASLQNLKVNCTKTETSCSFNDKIQSLWDPLGQYSNYLNGKNTNLPNANRKTLKADHDTKYHNNQLVMETDLGNSVEDTIVGRNVEEDMNTELQSSGSVGTASQRTKGSTTIGDLLRRLRPRRKPRKPCESGALVIDHEALIFRMRST